MEFRELRYFLAVAREENFSKAAEYLHITQPNLSRQIQNLELHFGQPLFLRQGRRTILTEAGMLLRKRAEEILELYDRTESELVSPATDLSGDIHIGGGESYAVQLIAKTAKSIQKDYPDIKFHFFSADTNDVMEKIDKGLIDFGILIEPSTLVKYEYMRLPLTDIWGVLMRKDSPLAAKKNIEPHDLWHAPIIGSRHSLGQSIVTDWMQKKREELTIVATYNLIYNASLMVEEGMGYAIGLDKLINTTGNSKLCFKPLFPKLETNLYIAWKKYSVFSKPTEVFLEYLKENL